MVSRSLVCAGDKAHRPHPADAAAAAAAAKQQTVRPVSAVQSQRSLPSPAKAADAPAFQSQSGPNSPTKTAGVSCQGPKVADISRQFSKAADLARQGSGGSDISRQGSRVSDISRQSSYSPKKASPIRQASTATSSFSPQSPAISAAFARASQQAKSTTEAQQSAPAKLPADSSLAPFAAADAQNQADTASADAQLVLQPPSLLPETTIVQQASKTASVSPTNTGAALASFPRIPLLLSRAESSGSQPRILQLQPSVTSDTLIPIPAETPLGGLRKLPSISSGNKAGGLSVSSQNIEDSSGMHFSAQDSRTQEAKVSDASGDIRIAMPPGASTSGDQIQSTLAAVQKDYVHMVGEQEEIRQAYAAADMTDEAAAQAASEAGAGSDSGIAGLFQPAYIPAVPLNSRASVRRGNNALFQKLAAGQPGAGD